jgi:hypothetical protein
MCGYKVIELENSRQVIRNVIELIGYGLLYVEEVQTYIGFKNPTQVYQILRGTCDTSEAKIELLRELWRQRRLALDQKKTVAKSLYGLPTLVSGSEQKTSSLVQATVVSMVESFFTLLELELIERLSSAEPQIVKKLHEASIRIANRFGFLCMNGKPNAQPQEGDGN